MNGDIAEVFLLPAAAAVSIFRWRNSSNDEEDEDTAAVPRCVCGGSTACIPRCDGRRGTAVSASFWICSMKLEAA